MHHGRAEIVTQARQEVLTQVYAEHPERFVRQPPKAPQLPTQVWINPPPAKEGGNQDPTNSVPQSGLPEFPTIDDLKSARPVLPPQASPLGVVPPRQEGGKTIEGSPLGGCWGWPRWEIAEQRGAIVGDTGGDQEVSPGGGRSPPEDTGEAPLPSPGKERSLNNKKNYRRTVTLLQ